jgi:tRNA dimethylallyltransferase
VRALIFGLAEAPPGDEGIRERHRQWAQIEGRASLHQKLKKVDPVSAERLHENDLVRVSRALEVHEISGTPLSTLQKRHGFREPHFSARLVTVNWELSQYEERLRKRILGMLEAGWVDEVRDLLRRGYVAARAMDAVGYRQVRSVVEAAEGEVNVEELATAITQVTRVFARRQRTWLRDEKVHRFSAEDLQNDARLDALWAELAPPTRS